MPPSLFIYYTLIEHTYNIYICNSSSAALIFFIATARQRASSEMPSQDSKSGLPYSKPTRYYLNHAAPCWSGPAFLS
jgi:hypothetical protein